MRLLWVVFVASFGIVAASCEGRVTYLPTEPTEPYSPPPPPPPRPPAPPIPAVMFGEVIRFRFTAEDWACNREGRCRSYNVTVPSDGELTVVIVPATTVDDLSFDTLEMYIVPGADDWKFGPGRQISATARVSAGATYEIRMFNPRVPSVELELRMTLR